MRRGFGECRHEATGRIVGISANARAETGGMPPVRFKELEPWFALGRHAFRIRRQHHRQPGGGKFCDVGA